jgi:hypothetical protein
VTDDDLEYDLEEVKRNIDSAEVMSVFFPTFRRSVVIDTRTNDHDGPMVRIMPMVASPQERLRSLRRLRPTFPRVHNLALIPWPRYVDSLVDLGVWGRIVNRFEGAGQSETVAVCEAVLEELRVLEKAEMAAVVRGENYHTLWSARD